MSRTTVLAVILAATSLAAADTHHGLTQTAQVTQPDQAIVGGLDVPAGKWPDTVAVLGETGICTGTLIAPDVVLTAGHCADITPLTVIANTTNYAGSGGAKVKVLRTVAYPNWDTTYDVSIVILAQPITSVTPRAIGTSCSFHNFLPDTAVRLVGFGATDSQGVTSNTNLKEAMTAVIDPTCSGGFGCNKSVSPGGEFVAGGAGTADSCFGDSGGPVYLETARGPIVIGAVSRGVNNAATPCGSGGIYVRTDKIVQWIEETAGKSVSKDDCAGEDFSADVVEDETAPADEVGCSSTGSSTSTLGFGALALGLALARRRRRS